MNGTWLAAYKPPLPRPQSVAGELPTAIAVAAEILHQEIKGKSTDEVRHWKKHGSQRPPHQQKSVDELLFATRKIISSELLRDDEVEMKVS